MKSLFFLSIISVVCVFTSGSFAQTATATVSTPASSAVTAATELSEAEVRKVDKEAKKVTLKHGPIKNLDMPGMTMVFQVRDVSLLDKIQAGDTIQFRAEQQQGAYVLTRIEKPQLK